jgi:hypothetical protein
MANNTTPFNGLLTGASQLAQLLALRARPGFSTDPSDYLPQRVRLICDELNPMAPGYRPELDPKGFLIEKNGVGAAGKPVIILGKLSGHEEVDRVLVDGKDTTRRYMIWERQPEVTPVKGKGGGLRTARNGWIKRRYDEVFLLIDNRLCVLPLYDAHHVVAELNQRAEPLAIAAFYEARWQLTKVEKPDGDYTRTEPNFELLGIVGQPNGPSEAEIAHAKKLSGLISQLSYANPDIPLRLVVNSPDIGSPPEPTAPPVQSPDDYDGGRNNDDLDGDIPF